MGKNKHDNKHNNAHSSQPAVEKDDIDELAVTSSNTENTESDDAPTSSQLAEEQATTITTATSAASAVDDNTYGVFTPLITKAKELLDSYQGKLRSEPLKTKMITSCVISLIGEVIGSYIKRGKARELMNINRNRHNNRNNSSAAMMLPPLLDPKRLAIFGVYGFAITGPVFHWWYGTLAKTVSSWNLSGNTSTLVNILLDRLLLTPPFLLFTLVYLNYFQNLNVSKMSTAVKNAYAGALYLNWKVWTPAQAINFKYVPLEYRVLFGNMVALWWNIILSLNTQS